jgi:SRSO17 transposase
LAGITPAELAAIRGRLEAFADDIFESLPRKDQRVRGQCYLRGLMLDGRRKSIEPMAQRLGGEVHYQALHHFVAVSPWDWRPVRRRLAERLVAELQPTAWAVDDTGFPKDGDHSVGVQRQYCEDGGARRPRAWSDSRQYRLRASPVICRPGSEAVSRHHRVGVVSL